MITDNVALTKDPSVLAGNPPFLAIVSVGYWVRRWERYYIRGMKFVGVPGWIKVPMKRIFFISLFERAFKMRKEWRLFYRPFPSSPPPPFQSEAKCEVFVMKISFNS